MRAYASALALMVPGFDSGVHPFHMGDTIDLLGDSLQEVIYGIERVGRTLEELKALRKMEAH